MRRPSIETAPLALIALSLLLTSCRDSPAVADQNSSNPAASSFAARRAADPPSRSCSAQWQAVAVKRCQLLVAMATFPEAGFDQEVANQIGLLRQNCPSGSRFLKIASAAASNVTASSLPRDAPVGVVTEWCRSRVAELSKHQPAIPAVAVQEPGRRADSEAVVHHDHQAK